MFSCIIRTIVSALGWAAFFTLVVLAGVGAITGPIGWAIIAGVISFLFGAVFMIWVMATCKG